MTAYLDLAEQLVGQLEGCRLTGYADSTGKPTNGYGHTGPEVRIGQTITQEVADHDLQVDLATADQRLQAVTDPGMFSDLAEHQKAALVSFVFNVGAGDGWQIWKDIDKGNLADVPTQLRRFDHGVVNGVEQVIPGLANRREAEIAFWNTADTAAAVAIVQAAPVAAPPSGFTRDISTPPAPTPVPPLNKTSLGVKLVTAATGIGATATQLHGVIAPHAVESPVFANIAIGLTGVVVLAACVGLLIHVKQTELRST